MRREGKKFDFCPTWQEVNLLLPLPLGPSPVPSPLQKMYPEVSRTHISALQDVLYIVGA